MTLLTPRRRARPSIGSIAALSAGGLAAGAAAWWFLDPRRGAEHRQRAEEKLRNARTQVSGRTQKLRSKAAEAARTYQARASEGARSLGERARGAAEEVKATARDLQATAQHGAARLEASGVPRDRALTGTAAAVLLVRAAMGGGLLRLPLALAGATLLSRIAGESETLKKGVTRTRDAARSAADRLHDVGASEGGPARAHRGGRREPEVREVKSPGELEQGVASGRPDPTFQDRVDRSGPHMGGGGGGGGRGGRWNAGAADEDRERDAGLGAPGTDDVVGGRAGFDRPEPGAGVREEELGAVAPREARPEGEETPAPRIAGADEDPATRRAAGKADAARKDPTSDGG